MRQIEATGKKIEDAIANGLKELGVEQHDVDIEIITMPGGFLGLRKAKVRLTVTAEEKKTEKKAEKNKKAENKLEEKKPEQLHEQKKSDKKKDDKKAERKEEKKDFKRVEKEEKKEKKAEVKTEKKQKPASAPTRPVVESKQKPATEKQVENAKNYVTKLLELMGIQAEIVVDTSHGGIDVDIITEDVAVIGHHGEVLDAIQVLTKRAAEESEDKFIRVVVDSNGYRLKREKALVSLAERMAAKCIKTGRRVVLEPMNNNHRKIIHATLSSNDKIITRSEGREPNRRVVIMVKKDRKQ